METRLTIQIWLLRAALLALPVLLGLSLRAVRRFVREVPRPVALALLGVLVLSLVARALGGLWSVNHENALGYVIFEDAVALDHVPFYGLGGHVWYNALLTVFPTAPSTLFASNFLLGALTPLLVFAVAWGLLRHGPAALLAATLLAANPCHVRLSASESLHVPLLFFGLLAAAALLVALEQTRARAPALLAGLSCALAVQTRPLGALLAVPVLLVLVTRPVGDRPWWRRGDLWLAATLAAAVVAPHGYEIVDRLGQGGGQLDFFRVGPATVLPRLLVPAQHALVDWAVTPPILPLCLLLGVVALAWRDRRSLLVLLPTWLVFTYFHTTHGENPVDQLRFHMGTLPWAVLLAGSAARLADPLRPRARAALAAGLVALTLSGFVLQRGVLTARYDAHHEYDFLAEAHPALPDGATLVHLDRFTADRVLTTELPRSWLRAEGKLSASRFASQLLEVPTDTPPDAGPVVWYRGVTCWSFVPHVDFRDEDEGTPRPTVRALCRALENAYTMTPIAERTFAASPDRFVVPAPRITIGFYRLDARAPTP